MKHVMLNVALILATSGWVAGCGKQDPVVNNQLPASTGAYPYSGSYPYLNQYCVNNTIASGSSIKSGWKMLWGKSYMQWLDTYAQLCANAKVYIKATSQKDLLVSNGYSQSFSVSKSDLAAGTTVTFQTPGVLVLGMDTKDFKLSNLTITVSY